MRILPVGYGLNASFSAQAFSNEKTLNYSGTELVEPIVNCGFESIGLHAQGRGIAIILPLMQSIQHLESGRQRSVRQLRFVQLSIEKLRRIKNSTEPNYSGRKIGNLEDSFELNLVTRINS